jgi:beta-mannosidase
MGTLFWQFNDCWQGPSWSVIDYDKKEKIAYGVVKEMYQPIATFVEFTNDSVKISVISDRMDSTNIDLRLFAVSGDATVKIWEENLVARPNQKQVVLLEPVKFFNLLGRSAKRIRLDMESSTGETFTDEIDIKL